MRSSRMVARGWSVGGITFVGLRSWSRVIGDACQGFTSATGTRWRNFSAETRARATPSCGAEDQTRSIPCGPWARG